MQPCFKVRSAYSTTESSQMGRKRRFTKEEEPDAHDEASPGSSEGCSNVRSKLDQSLFTRPQIYPPPGVDPFALLEWCSVDKRKMEGDIKSRFKQLLTRFDQCNKYKFGKRMTHISKKKAECALCRVRIRSANAMVEHICTEEHISKLAGSVCADAFDYWWNAVDTVVIEEGAVFLPPQISPPPGVDPFALLGSCDGAERKMEGDIESRFKQLLARFDQCDKSIFWKRTIDFSKSKPECSLCQVKIKSANNMIKHICWKNHISKMNGVVCANSFDYWWYTVNAFVVDTVASGDTVATEEAGRECEEDGVDKPIQASIDRRPSITVPSSSSTFPPPQASPPPRVDPFSLLASCDGAERKMEGDISSRFNQLLSRFNHCDKNMFGKRMIHINKEKAECLLCRVNIRSAIAMVKHICTEEHISKLAGSVCADAFDYWWNAVNAFVADTVASGDTVATKEAGMESEEDGVDNPVEASIDGHPSITVPSSNSAFSPSQMPPPHVVDPLALLRRCPDARRKLESPFRHFKRLRALFDRCDKERLEQGYSLLVSGAPECQVKCKVKISSANDFLVHVCDGRHVSRLGTIVCADAFDFWWNAVEAVVVDTVASGDTVATEASIDHRPSIILSCPKLPSGSAFSPSQISPPPGVDPFALLGSCDGAERKIRHDVEMRFRDLLARFENCDKERLGLQTSALFDGDAKRVCSLCDVKIGSATEVVAHVCSGEHLRAMAGSVCEDAFHFWWSAVETVLKAEEEQYSPSPGAQPFALLNPWNAGGRTVSSDLLEKLSFKFARCNQKRLEHRLQAEFRKYKKWWCRVCDHKLNRKLPSTVIHHIFGSAHISKMGDSACADAFDFWWNAVDAVTEECLPRPAFDVKPEPAFDANQNPEVKLEPAVDVKPEPVFDVKLEPAFDPEPNQNPPVVRPEPASGCQSDSRKRAGTEMASGSSPKRVKIPSIGMCG